MSEPDWGDVQDALANASEKIDHAMGALALQWAAHKASRRVEIGEAPALVEADQKIAECKRLIRGWGLDPEDPAHLRAMVLGAAFSTMGRPVSHVVGPLYGHLIEEGKAP